MSIRFLDDDDLVEQDRDLLHRILYFNDDFASNIEDAESSKKYIFKALANRDALQSPDSRSMTSECVKSSESSPCATPVTVQKQFGGWASLFKNSSYEAIVVNSDSATDDTVTSVVDSSLANGKCGKIFTKSDYGKTVVRVVDDSSRTIIKDTLRMVQLDHRGPQFRPKGLYNTGNWCYANAVLQALVACPPFFHLMEFLHPLSTRTVTCTPILDALSRFISEFVSFDRKSYRESNGAFEPIYLRKMIARLKSDAAYKGRQEDAEELLLALLNGLHDEMASVVGFDDENADNRLKNDKQLLQQADEADEAEWQQVVTHGRKHPITRQATTADTPLSAIFMGHLRFSISRSGAKDSANIEPFFTLPLEIQDDQVTDLTSALSNTLKLETFKGQKQGEIRRRGHIEDLPPVFILQLKYFVYTIDGGVRKLLKRIQFGLDLSIDKAVLSSQVPTTHRHYKLFAAVFHHGEKTQDGHYTVRIFHAGHWLLIDDRKIDGIARNEVSTCDQTTVPYLLFYRRCDLMQKSS